MIFQLILCALAVDAVYGHGKLMDPPNRSSLWRLPEFAQYNPEPNYSDEELWCGNVRQFDVDTRCGVCGDPVDKPMPRENENGGRYGRGIITREYTAGQTIPIRFESSAPHGGYFEIGVCDQLPETDGCFRPMVLGNGQTKWPMHLGNPDFLVETTAQLPGDVHCDHCVIRMHWRGAQNWGNCDNSASCECDPNSNPPGGMGCGEQQTFRSCSDVRIR